MSRLLKRRGKAAEQPLAAVPGAPGTAKPFPVARPSDNAVAVPGASGRERSFGKQRSSGDGATVSAEYTAKWSAFYESDRRSTLRKSAIIIVALLIVTLYSLTLGHNNAGTVGLQHYSLFDAFRAISVGITSTFEQLVGSIDATEVERRARELGMYYELTSRAIQTLITLIGGILIAVAGMLFQLVFRNPIASPTILGVNSGVQIGQLLAIVVFGMEALRMQVALFGFSFLGGIIVLALVFVCGMVTSSDRGVFEVKNMLLAGTMLSQVLGIVITIVTSEHFSIEIHRAYTLLSNTQNNQSSLFVLGLVTVSLIVSMFPIIRGSFKYNLLTLSEEEMRVGGLDPSRSRALVLACGSLMILAAQSALGTIAVISLVVPFIARAVFGVDFRKQLLGCVLIGMLLVMCCYIASVLIPFGQSGVGMSVIANIVLVPLYAWIVATNEQALRM